MADDKTPLAPRGSRAKVEGEGEDQSLKEQENVMSAQDMGLKSQEEQGASGTGGALPIHPDTAETENAQKIALAALQEQARKDAIKVGPGTNAGKVIEGEDAFDVEEPGVLMNFPKDVVLTDDRGHQRIHFAAGANEVPERLADHWFLKANGVTRAQPRLRRRGRMATEA